MPISQSRSGGDSSPDPSPTDEATFHRQRAQHVSNSAPEPHGYPFPPPTYYHAPQRVVRRVSEDARFDRTPVRHPGDYQPNHEIKAHNPIYMPAPKQTRKSKPVKKVEGKQPTFLTKLYS